MITDEQLMLQAKSGDMQCISDLFVRHHKELYTFYYRQSQDDSLSKDLVQNLFERIIMNRSKYDEKYPFKPWLFKLAWNEQNDFYRKRKLTLPGNEHMAIILTQSEEQPSNDNNEERQQRLKVAMRQLSQAQQELIQLTQFQGLKYAEVADILGCSLSAIKVRMHRTMKTLKNEYLITKGHEY